MSSVKTKCENKRVHKKCCKRLNSHPFLPLFFSFFFFSTPLPHQFSLHYFFTEYTLDRLLDHIIFSLHWCFRKSVNDLSTTCQRPVNDLSTTCQRPVNDLSTTCQRPVNDLSTTCQRPVNDLSTTCQRPVNDLSISTPPGAPFIFVFFFSLLSWLHKYIQYFFSRFFQYQYIDQYHVGNFQYIDTFTV